MSVWGAAFVLPHYPTARSKANSTVPITPALHRLRCCPSRLQFRTTSTMRSLLMAADALFASSPVTIRASLMVPETDRFHALGRCLEEMILSDDPDCPSDDLNIRVYQYYLPIYLWARKMLAEHNKNSCRPLMLGFSCPQVCHD
jgi:hypothetical protein